MVQINSDMSTLQSLLAAPLPSNDHEKNNLQVHTVSHLDGIQSLLVRQYKLNSFHPWVLIYFLQSDFLHPSKLMPKSIMSATIISTFQFSFLKHTCESNQLLL